MSRGKDLIKNTGILFLGKISTQFVSFLLLPLYTAKLSTAEYGTLDLYTTIASILIPILTLQIEQAVFRFLITNEEKEDTVITSVTVFTFLSAFVLAAVYIIATRIISIDYAAVVLFYFISMMFDVVCQQIPRGYSDYKYYTLVVFLSSTVSIAFSVVNICVFGMGVEGVLLSHIISSAFVAVFVTFKYKLYAKLHLKCYSGKCLRSMLKYSVPLVFNQLASWIVNYSDRIIIITILGVAVNGIYAIANKFFSLVTTMLNIYNIAWTEAVTKSLNDESKSSFYNKTITFTTLLFNIGTLFVISGIGIVFKYFVNIDYNSAYYHIPILIYAATFSGLSANIGSFYIAHKNTKIISKTTLYSAVVNIIVHLSLIRFCGLYAASISTLASFVFMFFFRIYHLKSIENVVFDIRKLIIQVPTMVVVLMSYYSRNIIFQISAFIILCVYFAYFALTDKLMRDQINSFYYYVKRGHCNDEKE